MKKNEKDWSLASIWNQAFEQIEPEIQKPRAYLYASELGNSFIEVYYKLRGVQYTNTFTVVNRRKMEAGKMFESIVQYVLKRAGILQKAQLVTDYQIKGCLETHGRLDFVAGGKINIEQAEQCIEAYKAFCAEINFPPIYQAIADKFFAGIKDLAGTKNYQLATYILELKSVSDFVFRLIEGSKRPLNYHHIQNFHYQLASGIHLGRVCYINRDDVRLIEKPVIHNEASYKEYATWIEKMTDYSMSPIPPDKEPLIVWHADTCSFGKNTVGVEWCKYLTMIYGFATAEAYRDAIMPTVTGWNRVMERCVKNYAMTDDNKQKIQEAKKFGFDWDRLVDLSKLRVVKLQEGKERVA